LSITVAGSELLYKELMICPAITSGDYAKHVTITDIWVDLPASVSGGRAIWGVPKGLCQFTFEEQVSGPLARSSWIAGVDDTPIASARFTGASKLAVRLPVPSGRIYQPVLPEGDGPKMGTMAASARFLPCRATWTFHPSGPLGWLAGQRPIVSVRARNFRMRMGVAD
jgi:acetoacetate decarboxylase